MVYKLLCTYEATGTKHINYDFSLQSPPKPKTVEQVLTCIHSMPRGINQRIISGDQLIISMLTTSQKDYLDYDEETEFSITIEEDRCTDEHIYVKFDDIKLISAKLITDEEAERFDNIYSDFE
jgi:hypothetical protein